MSTRAQFFAVFVATLVGIVALSLYGFELLEAIASEAEKMNTDMKSLQVVSDLEDDLRDLSSNVTGEQRSKSRTLLELNLTKLARIPPDPTDVQVLEEFRRAVDRARAADVADAWIAAGQATGAVEDRIIKRSQTWDTMRHADRNARSLLYYGGGIVLLFAVASALVFARWQRERDEAQERLRRSDQLAALGTIAASVAHEINNPLATISGCATAVHDRVKRQTEPCSDSIEYLEMIQDESRRCASILKSLRDLARDGPPAMTAADVAKIVRSVVALIEVDRRAKQVTFSVLGDEHLDAICDPDKLKQLLLNLFINARDASEPGGTVAVTVAHTGPGVARIEVADRGRGIDKRDLVRIFEPFHTDKTQGLGIGLFLCQRIAAQHGGTIRAQSEGRGKGAQFVVEFPTRSPANVPADAVS
jgi:signal transduction histidine kinase